MTKGLFEVLVAFWREGGWWLVGELDLDVLGLFWIWRFDRAYGGDGG